MIFTKYTDKFYWFFKTDNSKSRTYKSIKYKIEHITNLNLLQKFVADCYNTICDDVVKIIKKRVKINQHKENKLYSFIININIKI